MAEHTLHLDATPFMLISEGHKTIESRLYDAKRQMISLGDNLKFENRESGAQLTAEVISLHRYQSFEKLFNALDPSLFGNESRDLLLENIRTLYSLEDEAKYGVIGLEFSLLIPKI